MNTKISGRMWVSIILIGLFGQFAWTIENMYFNVYLYNTVSTDPRYIAQMVAWSAATATITTLLMGALSDKLGKRKIFICLGYLLWGLSTALFGYITIENTTKLFPAANAVALTAIMIVILDCIMTFFGSTANDAAFNAYVTDNTNNQNRARVESVLAVLPLVSMLVIFGLFDGMTQAGKWKEFFNIFGIAVTITGFISIFLLKDSTTITPQSSNNILYGFSPAVMKEHKELYLSLLSFCIFSIAVQVFFPYLIIYMQNYLNFDNYAIVLGIVLIFASAVSVLVGKYIDSIGKLRFVIPAVLIMFVGLVLMYFSRKAVVVTISGCIMMSGYMLVTSVLSANIRDWTPTDKAGHFQGIRMIFAVLIPMIIGPFIGAAVIRNGSGTYVELGQVKSVPTPSIFLASAIVLLFIFIPVFILKNKSSS